VTVTRESLWCLRYPSKMHESTSSSRSREPTGMGLKFLRMAKSSGANVIKLFTAVSYKFSQKAREFVRGNSFQPSLMFVGNSGAFLSEAPFRCSTLGKAPGLRASPPGHIFQLLHSRVGS